MGQGDAFSRTSASASYDSQLLLHLKLDSSKSPQHNLTDQSMSYLL